MSQSTAVSGPVIFRPTYRLGMLWLCIGGAVLLLCVAAVDAQGWITRSPNARWMNAWGWVQWLVLAAGAGGVAWFAHQHDSHTQLVLDEAALTYLPWRGKGWQLPLVDLRSGVIRVLPSGLGDIKTNRLTATGPALTVQIVPSIWFADSGRDDLWADSLSREPLQQPLRWFQNFSIAEQQAQLEALPLLIALNSRGVPLLQLPYPSASDENAYPGMAIGLEAMGGELGVTVLFSDLFFLFATTWAWFPFFCGLIVGVLTGLGLFQWLRQERVEGHESEPLPLKIMRYQLFLACFWGFSAFCFAYGALAKLI